MNEFPPVEVDDPRLAQLIDPGSAVERLASGCVWTEGPVYLTEDHAAGEAVLFSDIPKNRICRWSEADGFSVWRADAEHTNGHTLDHHGRLVSCSHGNRRIERTEPDGTVTELVASYQGRRLNSPNDLVVAADGAIWFTDPSYGILSDWEGHAAESEIGCHYVFRFDPDSGALVAVTDVLVASTPNMGSSGTTRRRNCGVCANSCRMRRKTGVAANSWENARRPRQRVSKR
jgi:gluconolactonase